MIDGKKLFFESRTRVLRPRSEYVDSEA